MIIGTALGWSNPATIALSVVLAFAFGYSLTMLPLLRTGLALGIALPLAFAYPVNRSLIARGQGQAVVHAFHGHGSAGHDQPSSHGSPRLFVLIGLVAVAATVAVTVGAAVLLESGEESTPTMVDHAGRS